MDRGYIDFAHLYVFHQAGAFFVTRAKSNLDAHRVYSAPTDRAVGIIADQTIAFDGFSTRRDYPVHLRRIRFKDAESGKSLAFLTNQFALPRRRTRRLRVSPHDRSRTRQTLRSYQPIWMRPQQPHAVFLNAA